VGFAARTNWTYDAALPAPLVKLLAASTRQSPERIRAVSLEAMLSVFSLAWGRDRPAWCPACVAAAVRHYGEAHRRALWSVGFSVVCPEHGQPLVGAIDARLISEGRPCCSRPELKFAELGGRASASVPALQCFARREDATWLAGRALRCPPGYQVSEQIGAPSYGRGSAGRLGNQYEAGPGACRGGRPLSSLRV
jgi:hypothetical protein